MAVRRTPLIAAAALVAVALTALPRADATEQVTTQRLSGSDRYSTAVAIAKKSYPNGVGEVVLASGEGFPDALAASFLAGVISGPILLVTRTSVPSATAQALADLNATKVYLVGGPAAITRAVEDELLKRYTVRRVAGVDRYDTARAVKQSQLITSVGRYNSKRTAFVASGESFADALAAGPIAFGKRFPLLLTARDFLPKATEDAGLDGIEHVIIVGGEAAVGPDVEAALRQKALTVERIGGENRNDTAAKLAETALAGMGFKNTEVAVASGIGFPDALAGATYAGKSLVPLLLMGSVPPETDAFVRSHNSTIATITALGGTSAVSDEDLAALATTATCRSSASPVTSVPVVSTIPGSTTSSSVPECSPTPPTSPVSSTSSTSTSAGGPATTPSPTTVTTPTGL